MTGGIRARSFSRFSIAVCGCWALAICVAAPRLAPAAGVSDGVAFLVSSQRPDGRWGDPHATGFRDTTAAVDALRAAGETGASFAAGVAALNNALVTNTDYLARQIVCLANVEADIAARVTRLLDAQDALLGAPTRPNFPGAGWGIAGGFATDTLDTALALRALTAVGAGGGLSVANEPVAVSAASPVHSFEFPAGASGLVIVVFATSGQIRLWETTPSNSSFYVDLSPASVPSQQNNLPQEVGTYRLQIENRDTAPVYYALAAGFVRADGFNLLRFTIPLTYLGLAQNPDGGWGTAIGETSTLLITAETLLTLTAAGATFAPAASLTTGSNYLAARQNADGGFSQQAGASTIYETALATLAMYGVSPQATALTAAKAYLHSTQRSDGSWDSNPYATALAVRALAVVDHPLDVDANGTADVATDVVYVSRRLLGLPPVPASFRLLDPSIPPDAQIGAEIDANGLEYDVDGNGVVDVATDLVYITRHLLGLPPVPPRYRLLDPTIPADSQIIFRIDALEH